MNPDQHQPTHKQVAKQFECSLDSSYDELLRGIADKSYILQAPYGEFDRHDRELVLPARITRGLGQTASLGETLQKKPEVILATSGIGDMPEAPAYAFFDSVLALQTGATVVRAGNPSVKNTRLAPLEPGQANHMTSEQRHALCMHGNFTPAAEAVAASLVQTLVHEHLEQSRKTAIAPSLGASILAAGLGGFYKRDVGLDGIAFLDPVGFEAYPARTRFAQMLKANAQIDTYRRFNHPLQNAAEGTQAETTRSFVQNAIPNLLYGARGITGGTMTRDIMEHHNLLKEAQTPILSISAGASEYETATATREAMSQLYDRGLNTDWRSIDNASHMITILTELWRHADRLLRLQTRAQ